MRAISAQLDCLKACIEELRFEEESNNSTSQRELSPNEEKQLNRMICEGQAKDEDKRVIDDWLASGCIDLRVDVDVLKRLSKIAVQLNKPALLDRCNDAMPWKSARSFEELIHLNRRFIEGKLSCTPYHDGPLDEETDTLKPSLLRMTEHELLTTGSQPYCHTVEERYEERWQIQQKPFVEFLVLEPWATVLFEALSRTNRIVVRATRVKTSEVWKGSHERVPVSRKRRVRHSKAAIDEAWEGTTAALCGIAQENDFYSLEAIKIADPIEFSVAAKDWNDEVDVLGTVIKARDDGWPALLRHTGETQRRLEEISKKAFALWEQRGYDETEVMEIPSRTVDKSEGSAQAL